MSYNIDHKSIPYKGYAQLIIPKEYRYFYEIIDYFYRYWGIRNVRLREDNRMVRIFVKSSHNPFHELFSFNDLEPFIKDGDWFVMDGNLYVRSNYRKTQITLPVSMIENLQSMAKEQDITTSQLIEKIIEDYEERRDK